MLQATLTFGFVQNGILQSQAAVVPNAPLDQAIISADIVPGIGRYLAFAIANTGSVPASISLTLRDEDGNVAATASLTLQSRQQIAKFVSEIPNEETAFPDEEKRNPRVEMAFPDERVDICDSESGGCGLGVTESGRLACLKTPAGLGDDLLI